MTIWQLVSGTLINTAFISSPLAVSRSFSKLVMSGDLLFHGWLTLQSALIGFSGGLIIGGLSGLILGRLPMLAKVLDPYIVVLYAIPNLALAPLFILWFGLGNTAKTFIVTILALFPILINTTAGVRNVPKQLIDVGDAFAANERQIFTKIILPSTLPYMMTGLRLGVGRAIIGMVVAEFFTAITGLGALIVKYGNQYDTASMFVPIFVLMLLGITLSLAVRRAEEWIAPWKATEE